MSFRPLDPSQLTPPFQSYLDAFCKLAEEEGLDYDKKKNGLPASCPSSASLTSNGSMTPVSASALQTS